MSPASSGMAETRAPSTLLRTGLWFEVAAVALALLGAGLYLAWRQYTGLADGYGYVALWFFLGTLAVVVPVTLIGLVLLCLAAIRRARRSGVNA